MTENRLIGVPTAPYGTKREAAQNRLIRAIRGFAARLAVGYGPRVLVTLDMPSARQVERLRREELDAGGDVAGTGVHGGAGPGAASQHRGLGGCG